LSELLPVDIRSANLRKNRRTSVVSSDAGKAEMGSVMNPKSKRKNDGLPNRIVANRDRECDSQLTSVTGFAGPMLPK
jgi:hypothetical protein